jgi:hypothetical protein
MNAERSRTNSQGNVQNERSAVFLEERVQVIFNITIKVSLGALSGYKGEKLGQNSIFVFHKKVREISI